tara:strand:+ start:3600 stop:3974 length:375 start_codon:yes stop_codon:yes gene_type:complete
MTNTIVKITYTNYTENVKINNSKKENELLDIKNRDNSFESYEVIKQGDYILKSDKIEMKTFAMGNNDEFQYEQTFEIIGNKVKAIIDTFGEDYRMCFQKINTTSKGQWVKVYGERIYFLNGINL